MSVPSRRMGLRRLVECAVLIAIGTVLSLFEFSGPWALGGGITVCSMLPLVLICHRHGTKWGISSALVYGVLGRRYRHVRCLSSACGRQGEVCLCRRT